jgi:hypothetical protein
MAMIALSFALLGPPHMSYAATNVFSVFNTDFAVLSPGQPILMLEKLPVGKYVINAKVNLDNDDTVAFYTLLCMLKAESSGIPVDPVNDVDVNHFRLAPSGYESIDNMVIPLQLVHEFSRREGNTITLSCQLESSGNPFPHISVGLARITAIQIDGDIIENSVWP